MYRSRRQSLGNSERFHRGSSVWSPRHALRTNLDPEWHFVHGASPDGVHVSRHAGPFGPFHASRMKLGLDPTEIHDVVESRALFGTGRLKVIHESLSDEELLEEL